MKRHPRGGGEPWAVKISTIVGFPRTLGMTVEIANDTGIYKSVLV